MALECRDMILSVDRESAKAQAGLSALQSRLSRIRVRQTELEREARRLLSSSESHQVTDGKDA